MASVGAAWLLARETAPVQVVSTEAPERGDTGSRSGAARLEGSRSGSRGDEGRAAERLRPFEVAVVPMAKPLDLEGAHTQDEILARLFAHAAANLAGGKDAHRHLYRTLDTLLKGKVLDQVFGDPSDGPRAIYPLARFLVERDAQVVEFAENVLRAAVDDPLFFEGTEGKTLEVLTEGVGPILPGMVSDERLERMRGHVKAVLAQPADRQPKAVQDNRDGLQKLLEQWVPLLPSAEAAARLKTGTVTGREALGLLKRVRPEDRASLDLDRLLGPMLDEGDLGGLTVAVMAGADARALSSLDTRLIDASSRSGRLGEWHFGQWLIATGRPGWEAARGFLEQALRMGGSTADAAALALLALAPRPPAETVDSLLRSYTVNARVAQNVRASFGIR
jgi:hypothetical protein